MRIGCLQFAPQVGDVDNNLNRADAVLSKAKLEELEELDMLVLPELAFSGKFDLRVSATFSPRCVCPLIP
jgi:predicted amidohydrolase